RHIHSRESFAWGALAPARHMRTVDQDIRVMCGAAITWPDLDRRDVTGLAEPRAQHELPEHIRPIGWNREGPRRSDHQVWRSKLPLRGERGNRRGSRAFRGAGAHPLLDSLDLRVG